MAELLLGGQEAEQRFEKSPMTFMLAWGTIIISFITALKITNWLRRVPKRAAKPAEVVSKKAASEAEPPAVGAQPAASRSRSAPRAASKSPARGKATRRAAAKREDANETVTSPVKTRAARSRSRSRK